MLTLEGNQPIIKGDTLNIQLAVNQSIAGWKIRCELFDKDGSSIQLANTLSGGGDSQIEADDVPNGVFTIHVAKNLTTNFADNSLIEVEIENNNSPTEIFTIYKDSVLFEDEKIDWEEPT